MRGAINDVVTCPQTWYVFDGDLLIGEVGTPFAVGGGGGVGGGGLEVLELAGPYVPQQGAAVAQMAYTWGAAGLVSSRSLPNNVEGGSNWYHFGPQGETRYLSGATGAPVAYTQYSGYGIASGGLAASTGFNFGGQFGYYTDYAGILCGARWYDPGMGRWLNRDPIGYDGGDNLYAYCAGDPIGMADEDGTLPNGDGRWVLARRIRPDPAADAAIKRFFSRLWSGLQRLGNDQAIFYGLKPAPTRAGRIRQSFRAAMMGGFGVGEFGAAEAAAGEAGAARGGAEAAECAAQEGAAARARVVPRAVPQAVSRRAPIKAAELPVNTGKVRYVPPASWQPTMPLPRGPRNGFVDRFGNEWIKGPPHHFPEDTFEWDVQLRNGKHWNISRKGIARGNR